MMHFGAEIQGATTIDGSEILHHLGCIKPCTVNNWINYQPQLVSGISETSTVSQVSQESITLHIWHPKLEMFELAILARVPCRGS